MFGFRQGFARTSRDGQDRARRPRPYKATIEPLDGRQLLSAMSVTGLLRGGSAHHAAFATGRDARASTPPRDAVAASTGSWSSVNQAVAAWSTNFLRNQATGYYLDSNAKQQVYTHVFNGGTYQKWQAIPSGDGYYFLRDGATGYYLDSNANQQVYTHVYNGGAYQKWQLIPSGDGYYFLRDQATGYYLDSNANQQVYTHVYNGGAYQKWRFDVTTP